MHAGLRLFVTLLLIDFVRPGYYLPRVLEIMFKISKNANSCFDLVDFNFKLIPGSKIHGYNTRQNSNFNLPRVRKT